MFLKAKLRGYNTKVRFVGKYINIFGPKETSWGQLIIKCLMQLLLVVPMMSLIRK